MEDVRQLVQEEGREARNLVAFHVAVDTPGRAVRKPPKAGLPPPRRAAPRTPARLRSASAGRDKRSELRARYWALLFGDLQRAVGELYNTVEAHENPHECQEVILVLENYTRDFKALCEWFRLKWKYESTPSPQRPQSLAWEIRKTDFVRPESRRTHSVKNSPPVSGKNSPCLSGHNTPSGKNSPNLTGKASPGSGKISPRMTGHSTSPKGSLEFFGNKISSKTATKPEAKVTKETRLSDIKEKDVKDVIEVIEKTKTDLNEKEAPKPSAELGKAKECPNVAPKQVIIKSPKRAPSAEGNKVMTNGELSSQALNTIDKLNAMESEFLAKNLSENAAKNENMLNQDFEDAKVRDTDVTKPISIAIESTDHDSISTESPSKSEDNFGDVSNESSKCDDKLPEITPDETKPNKATGNYDTSQNVFQVNETNKVTLKYDDLIPKLTNTGTDDISQKVSQANETNRAKVDDAIPKETNNYIIKDIKLNDIPKTDVKDKAKVEAHTNIKEMHQAKKDGGKDTKKEENKETKPKVKAEAASIDKETCNSKKDDVKGTKMEENKEIKKDDIKHLNENKSQIEQYKDADGKKDDTKKAETKLSSESKPTRPAYSQAAAKPKLVTAKIEVKTPARTALARSKTVVEIRNFPLAKSRTFVNKNQKNKCSYPFNLTTGRSSLFDGGATKLTNPAKKPISKALTQMAAGDSRNQTKPDIKSRPPRPISLKINEKGDKPEKINAAFEKIKDFDEYSSSDTVVTQIDMSRIESSESLKTIVPEDHDVANSIEVLHVDNKNDDEGWLTVKSRRLSRESKKSKSHWSNRFHQPSATTSLPTLNMLESPKSETNPIVSSKLDRAKSEQPQNKPEQKMEKVVKVAVEPKREKAKETSMIRQKSDVTGLKTRSSRNKALKKDKNKDKNYSEEKLTKNRLHSSLESLTMGLARSQESTEDSFDFDKWKAEFKSTFKYLEYDDQIQDDTEILKTADPSEMSEIAEMTSQIEENERKISLALDFQSEVDQRKLCEEEDLLNRQIMELQQVSDIDIDTETDDTETDAEILCEDSNLASPCQSTETLSSISASLEDQYETALAGMSWAERVDTLGALEALVARDPGRAQQLHEKLSQGMRRRGSLQDALRRLQAKQARAERQRTRFHTERAERIHQLLARVEEVKVAKNQLIDEKRIRMERRLQKAAENRDQHLKDIVRKAHDEEEKLREIAFIKQLEAENRRHEFLEQCRSHTTRLREMRRERLDKLEQKAAREAAVGARRQALEAARRLHVASLLERRRERDARVEGLKELRRQERDDAAREKAEGVKSRLSALAAAAELEADALRSRIRDKQDASQQRLESHLQAIREKATGPRQATTSESHEPDRNEEQEEKAALERDKKERERQRNVRKRARKLRQKLLADTKDVPLIENADVHTIHPNAVKMHKVVNQIHNLIKHLISDDDKIQNGGGEAKIHDNNAVDICKDEEKSARKKKKNKSRDRQLSACDSIGSAVSDVSRGGNKPNTSATLDSVALERSLNELHRMCMCADNLHNILRTEKTFYTKLHAIRTLGHLLHIAVEREDVASQLNARAINTCVCCIVRVCVCCPLAASLWLRQPGLVHAVVLLAGQMEKDLLSDTREDELTKNLAEAVVVGLNACLHDLIAKSALARNRTRGHLIISFLCLSGCVSYPERCGESRSCLQMLLNVCGDLLAPVEGCDGQERVMALQNLRSVLGPSIFNIRNDFCMLFAEGAEISQSDIFVRAARIAHVLRALAELDHRIVQDAFGEGGWPLEFRAAVARLMTQHAPSDKEAPRKEMLRPCSVRLDADVSETFVLDLIILIGYVLVNNPQLQETICDNWSVIKMLCNLPANWMVSPPQMHKLLPTLLVLAERPATADVIASEISMQMLRDYLNSEVAQRVKIIQLLKQGQKEAKKVLKN